jgi:hypothetical protein
VKSARGTVTSAPPDHECSWVWVYVCSCVVVTCVCLCVVVGLLCTFVACFVLFLVTQVVLGGEVWG